MLTDLWKGWRVGSQLGLQNDFQNWASSKATILSQSQPRLQLCISVALQCHGESCLSFPGWDGLPGSSPCGCSSSSGDLGHLVFSDENVHGPCTLPERGCNQNAWSPYGLDHPHGLSVTSSTFSLFQTWLVHSYLDSGTCLSPASCGQGSTAGLLGMGPWAWQAFVSLLAGSPPWPLTPPDANLSCFPALCSDGNDYVIETNLCHLKVFLEQSREGLNK